MGVVVRREARSADAWGIDWPIRAARQWLYALEFDRGRDRPGVTVVRAEALLPCRPEE